MIKRKSAIIISGVLLVLISVIWQIEYSNKHSVKNEKWIAKLWSQKGAINTEVILLTDNKFYSEILGDLYIGKYELIDSLIIFESGNLEYLELCSKYQITDTKRQFRTLIPEEGCGFDTLFLEFE